MQPMPVEQDPDIPRAPAAPGAGTARLLIGVLQGFALLFVLLFYAGLVERQGRVALEFAPLLAVCVFVPVVLTSSLGALTRKQAAGWAGAVALAVAAIAFHDVWRLAPDAIQVSKGRPYPSWHFFVFCTVALYIAQSLLLAGVHDRRRVASYASYFETAWKLFVQLLFSAMFVGALWIVLLVGAGLFELVRLDFLKALLGQLWFNIPVTTAAFACAIHVTDVRPAIVRGIRTLSLTLLAWILPIAALLVAGFLLTLPWTGLEALWATRRATSVLLGTAALLIVLINAAYQNGEASGRVARLVRWSARLAALALLPLVAIAVHALWLRVGEHGWTSERLVAAACLLVAGCYALGYGWAAIRRGPWLAAIAPVNVFAAFVVLAVLLVLFSPLGDPVRISVNSQLARLEQGKVPAAGFDFDYLRFEGKRFGQAALVRLAGRSEGADAVFIREQAALALARKARWDGVPLEKPQHLAENIHVWPPGARLPASFLEKNWAQSNHWALPKCLSQRAQTCDAYLVDFDGDRRDEVLLLATGTQAGNVILRESASGEWNPVARLPDSLHRCAPLREQLRTGSFRLVEPAGRDIEVGGKRIEVLPWHDMPRLECREWSD